MLPSEPAARHRVVAGAFTDLVTATRSWEAPAPVAGWVARDVVGHLVEWLPAFLAGGAAIELPTGPPVDQDPVGAWQTSYDAVQALLDDPATTGRMLSNPHIGDIPVDVAIERFYVSDVFMHAWDLAAATGQPYELDADTCAEMLAGMEPMEEAMRGSGQYGPRVPVPDDATVQDRLLGFIGRDPHWTPQV